MFEFVHTSPDGSSDLTDIASTAKKAGYSSLVTRNHNKSVDTDIPFNNDEIDLYSGIEIKTKDIEKMNELIFQNQNLDFICVHGGTPKINKAAVNSRHVDILCHPERSNKRSFNHALIREASETNVAIEINLSNILRASGGIRVQTIRDIKILLKLIQKYNTRFVISSDPFSRLHIRTPREIKSICDILGIKKADVDIGMKINPEKILEKGKNIDVK